jgi:beta-glucosidase
MKLAIKYNLLMKTHSFPTEFLWGTATAAHQIEGNNTNSDWWQWELDRHKKFLGPQDQSQQACDSYNRYAEDFDLCKQMNNNAVRFSIEWARIEPQEGVFDQTAIEHYKKMLEAAKKRGLKTFVTLHHFTNPMWFAKKGGWANKDAPKYFQNYVRVCANEFSSLVDTFITVNEPQVLISIAYIAGLWPPQKRNLLKAIKVRNNFIQTHKLAYAEIKKVSNTPVGFASQILWFEKTNNWNFVAMLIKKVLFKLNADYFLQPLKEHMDFIGLNYYITFKLRHIIFRPKKTECSDIGWWIHPEGMRNILNYLKKYNLPIYITENGLSDSADEKRINFIQRHLVEIWQAIQDGIDIRGYFHWTLMDNYEWHQGYIPKFGLFAVDRENNLTRVPRPSVAFYSEICKDNAV